MGSQAMATNTWSTPHEIGQLNNQSVVVSFNLKLDAIRLLNRAK